MEKHNSNSDAPAWINSDFLAKILSQNGYKGPVKSWEIERATVPGDNYGSVIYRVTADLQNGDEISKSLIVKVELTTEELSKFVSEANVFVREIYVYNKLIPKMNSMLKELSRNFQPFAPDCYYTHVGPPGSVLVFEDLKKESFRLAERSVGLDMEHTLLVIKRLAVYHASSVVLHEKQPELFEPMLSSVYGKHNIELLRSLIEPVFNGLADEIEKWPGYKERFSNKLREMADKGTDMILDGVTRDEGDFNVLAHEDPWLNNIMFRYSEHTGKVVDLRLVDFQGCQWQAPAIDIQRYLQSTATAEVVEQHECIVEEYLKVLRETLDSLGYVHLCPTIEHMKCQMNRRATFGVVIGILTRAFFLADVPDVDRVMRNEGKFELSDLFKEVVRKQLPLLEKYHWI